MYGYMYTSNLECVIELHRELEPSYKLGKFERFKLPTNLTPMTGNKETTALTLKFYYRELKIKLDKYISKLLHEWEHICCVKGNKRKQSKATVLRHPGTANFAGFKENITQLLQSYFMWLILYQEIASTFWTTVPLFLSCHKLTNMIWVIKGKNCFLREGNITLISKCMKILGKLIFELVQGSS